MAKSPNTTPFNGEGYNFKFTQDYPGWTNNFVNALYNLTTDQPKHPPLTEAQRIETENELAWLDYVESEFMKDMLTYPEAEAIINKVMKQQGDSNGTVG